MYTQAARSIIKKRMKKITSEEFDQLHLQGTGRASKFYKAIISLKPAEALVITKAEFTLKRTPMRICRLIMKRFPQVKYVFGPVADGSGWAIKREK